MRPTPLLFSLFSLLVASHAALAHPHIFARYRVTIAPSDPGYINLHFTFHFQGVANPILTPGMKTTDQQQLKQDMLANLNTHPFYIYLDMDGQYVGRQLVRPVPRPDGTEKDKAYTFDLAVPALVKSFAFALYDPEYFVFVQQNDATSVLTDVTQMPCATEERDVGKTMWGVLRAQYVVCGKASQGPRLNLKMQPPGAYPERLMDGINGRQIVP